MDHPETGWEDGTKERKRSRRVYQPPVAVIVPLKLEERLMSCGKLSREACDGRGLTS